MEQLGIYGLAFAFGTIKFLIAASLVSSSSLSPFEIAVATGLGALTSFNVFYWSSGFFMARMREKKSSAGNKSKKTFSKLNRFMVKTKMSRSGFWLICIFAPLFLSIPIGSIIVAKFYNEKKLTYPLAMLFICIWAFVLAYLNDVIFGYFGF